MTCAIHALPPEQTRARNRARARQGVGPALLIGLPAIVATAVFGNGGQEHASVLHYPTANDPTASRPKTAHESCANAH